jgi:hypothetical protein
VGFLILFDIIRSNNSNMRIFQLNIKKNRSNNLIIDLNISFKSLFYPFWKLAQLIFNSLDFLTYNNKTIGLLMALGLGIGIGITIFQNPDSSFATASYQNTQTQQQKTIKQLTVLSITTNVVAQKDLGRINPNHVSIQEQNPGNYYSQIVTLRFPSFDLLRKLTLGDSIEIIKNNNGIYKYKIIQIKTLDKNDINSLYTEDQETIIVYANKSLINQSIHAVIAKPAI